MYLVHKIYILPDGFETHFKVGESYVKVFLLNKEKSAVFTKKAQSFSESILDKKNALPDSTSGTHRNF